MWAGREGVVAVPQLSYFLMTRSDDMFTADLGMVHDVHCLTRGVVAFYAQSTQVDTDR